MTITPSTGMFEESDVLTCSANGYKPTYTWTGTAGVNRAIVSETGNIYTLPEGPFNVTCTANVSRLPPPCHASATVSDIAYSKYESNITIATVLAEKLTLLPKILCDANVQRQKYFCTSTSSTNVIKHVHWSDRV